MSRFLIEIYRGRSIKNGYPAKTVEEAEDFLADFVSPEELSSTISFLLQQEQNPKAFPNVVLFLDDDGQLMDMEKFVEKWKERK